MNALSASRGGMAFIVAAVVAVAAQPAAAGRITVSTASTAVISDGSGSSRILIRPGDLSAIRGRLVTSAYLSFTLPGQVAVRDIPVRVYPLTSDWSAGSVTWGSPWSRAGGDVEDAYYETRVVESGARATSLSLDVSPMVRAMAQGEIGEYGFLLTVAEHDGAGFRTADLTTLGTLTAATLEIDYRVTSRVQVAGTAAQPGAPASGLPVKPSGADKAQSGQADAEPRERER